ncbi:MAG TPA: ankyrin repeat domain-containing protein [Jatrophihabitantaceae bacterium]|nr:ankyrin repeat domain-containing protein [Jatrophihabitantaceae bacterium]
MRYLPALADLTQLRHQAKDLLHAAQRGDPDASGQIAAVSDRPTLAAAQLALARDYGFPSWPAMKAEVERRTILNLRDVDALRRLLADQPDLARRPLARFGDHRRGVEPLSLTAMLRFDARAAGLTADLRGTGAMAQALIDAGAPIEGGPGTRETPLITAASYGDAEAAAVLIAAGAQLETRAGADSGGVPGGTALEHAAVFGMTDVIDALVAAGARVESLEMAAAVGDVSGWSLDEADEQTRLRALVFAADHQRLEAVRALVSADTDVNTADAQWHRLPLHTAAEHGRPASVRLLLELGADPDLRDPDHGRTPLEWCQPENRYLSRPGHDEVDRILRPVTTAP